MAFDKMYKVFPDVMCGVDKSKLKCDACEYAKHTRTSYVSKGLRSISPFMLIHSDVWTCLMAVKYSHPGPHLNWILFIFLRKYLSKSCH